MRCRPPNVSKTGLFSPGLGHHLQPPSGWFRSFHFLPRATSSHPRVCSLSACSRLPCHTPAVLPQVRESPEPTAPSAPRGPSPTAQRPSLGFLTAAEGLVAPRQAPPDEPGDTRLPALSLWEPRCPRPRQPVRTERPPVRATPQPLPGPPSSVMTGSLRPLSPAKGKAQVRPLQGGRRGGRGDGGWGRRDGWRLLRWRSWALPSSRAREMLPTGGPGRSACLGGNKVRNYLISHKTQNA